MTDDTTTTAVVDREMSTRDLLDAIAATLGKPVWRHIHYTEKFGGHCATAGCACSERECTGLICGMQAVIDSHDAEVRAAAGERIALALMNADSLSRLTKAYVTSIARSVTADDNGEGAM